MTDKDKQAVEAIAQSVVDNPTHYVDSVSAMAGHLDLNATEDIVSSSGIMLAPRGTRIDARLREKLSGHRLSGATLEKTLSIAGGVSPESLATDLRRLIEADRWFKRLTAAHGDPGAMRHDVSHLKLPDEILFRLTVARDQRPPLYQHSLGVAIVSHFLGARLKLKQATINNVLVAALCHDLGELYIDPAILEPGHRVTDEERRFIYVHPIAGWLIVRELPGIDPEVASAVIQHQERLDGSGYPYGRKDDAIGIAGRILAVADVSASIMARTSDYHRLSTVLRLNNKKYDPKLADLLHDAITHEAPAAGPLERDAILKRLGGFAALLDGWGHLRASTTIAETAAGAFLLERMFNLRTAIIQFGFDPDSLEMPLKLAEEDATIAAELTEVVDELQYQLADLGREFDRREPDWMDSLDMLATVALKEWRRQLQACMDS